MLIGQNKFRKFGEQCMPRANETFPSTILGTRAVISSALF
jgi:hypothetical protein